MLTKIINLREEPHHERMEQKECIMDAAVKEWREKGFTVEYGRTKKPMNALIFFSEEPYIELLKDGGISSVARRILRLFGKGEFMERFDYWAKAPEGRTSLCIEKDPGGLEEEISCWVERCTIFGGSFNLN